MDIRYLDDPIGVAGLPREDFAPRSQRIPGNLQTDLYAEETDKNEDWRHSKREDPGEPKNDVVQGRCVERGDEHHDACREDRRRNTRKHPKAPSVLGLHW